jgi:hypothetical protein
MDEAKSVAKEQARRGGLQSQESTTEQDKEAGWPAEEKTAPKRGRNFQLKG